MRSGCSRRARAGADRVSRRPGRRADLRGHLGTGSRSDGSSKPAAKILIVTNASPYERDKLAPFARMSRAARVVESGLPLIYLNMVGGQEELVFDGGSFALNADRSLRNQLPTFRPMVAKTVWERGDKGWRCVEGPRAVVEEGDEADYAACVLGLREYVDDNRFPRGGSRPVRRRRLGFVRRDGGRCAWA